MKYIKEYEEADNRKEFIRLLLVRYSHIKSSTALRRYYDVKKHIKENVVGDMYKPTQTKLLMIEDMKKLGYPTDNYALKNHGFRLGEINWLRAEGLIK